jgi:hypothetical protein
MSSLWTPSGEHPVDRSAEGRNPSPRPTETTPPGTDAGAADAGEADEQRLEDLPPEQRAQVEEMARQMQDAQERMLRLPAGAVVGQYVLQLYDVAALYLSQDPPRLADGRLAIDALKAVVETLGNRLGEAEQPLRQTLHQIQLAFVELSNQAPSAAPSDPEP